MISSPKFFIPTHLHGQDAPLVVPRDVGRREDLITVEAGGQRLGPHAVDGPSEKERGGGVR